MCRRPGHRRSSCQLPPRGPVAAATRAERCCHPPLNIKDAAVIGDGECWLPTAVVAGSYRLARWPSRPAGVFAQCVVGERIDRPPAHGAVAFVCARPVSRPRRCRRSTYTCTSTTPASTTSGPARPSPRARPFCAQASVAVVVAICTPGLAALARLGRSRGAPPRAVFLTPTSTWAASARYPACTSHMSAARQARVRRGRDSGDRTVRPWATGHALHPKNRALSGKGSGTFGREPILDRAAMSTARPWLVRNRQQPIVQIGS